VTMIDTAAKPRRYVTSTPIDGPPACVSTGRPLARCPFCGSFSSGPRPKPDVHLSMHPAFQ
jgi:hypothetical protein